MLVAASTTTAFAEGFKLTTEEKAPPEDVRTDVTDHLNPTVHLISGEGDPFFEFWFAKSVDISKAATTMKDLIENLDEIALLGLLVVHDNEERADFRDDIIDPGTYVMRMCLQPQDGNHMGTSPYETFALLIIQDRDEEAVGYDDPIDMADIAAEHTAAEHPPILAFQPLEDPEGEYPRLTKHEDEEWHYLAIQFPATIEGEESKMSVNIVFEGIGDIE
jgi:hypothetical protein